MRLKWSVFDTWARKRYLMDSTDSRAVAYVSEGRLAANRWHAWTVGGPYKEDEFVGSFETEKEAMEFLEVLVKLESTGEQF